MKIKLLTAALLLLPALATAGVNPKNGDFYITYSDISLTSGEHELELTRTYNSKASGSGWFGYGWGSRYETRIVVMPDGSVVAHENGFGQANYYAPQDASGLQSGVDKIVAAAVQHDRLDAAEASALRRKLLASEEERRTSVAKYALKTELPVGGYAQSDDCAAGRVSRVAQGYSRVACDGTVDSFDLAGHLTRREQYGYAVDVHYAGDYPDRIEDSLGQKFFLIWTADGHIAESRAETPEQIHHYYYDEKHNLLLDDKIRGYFYKFKYDSNHNLTNIGYLDDTHMDMVYDDKGLITSVTERDGSKASYAYRYDPDHPEAHYWTTTTRVSAAGDTSTHEDEYNLASDGAGVEHMVALRHQSGERKQDVIMDEQGRIKTITNADGHLTEFFYHPTLNKIRAVVTNEVSTVFTYNPHGELLRAYNTHGQLITLAYDSKRRIVRMTESNQSEHTRRVLGFKYNAQDKPVLVSLQGKGNIDVSYDDKGEISSVTSKQGAVTALNVTQAFQTLLSMVQVAGVGF